MPLRVNNNIAAINARRQLNANNRDLGIRLERLASGLRINSAADDPAGLSVREWMRAEISGLKMNNVNAEQASNIIQVAEGSLNEVNSILIRMRSLAVESSSSTVNNTNREAIQAEFTQLTAEIDRIAAATTYNNEPLLTGYGNTIDTTSTALVDSNETGVTGIHISGAATGTYTFEDAGGDAKDDDGEITLGNGTISQTISISTQLDGDKVADGTQIVANFDRLGIQITLAGDDGLADDDAKKAGNYEDGDLDGKEIKIDSGVGGSFQVGPTDAAHNRIEVNIVDMSATGNNLGLAGSSVSTITDSRSAITEIDAAITTVAQQRGDLGAYQNRLGFAISYTQNEIENIQASEASISDADIAEEVTAFTRAQILSQAASAMLVQTNVMPQNALALLQ